MTLCSLTFSLKKPCCCGRNRMHIFYWGCLSGTLLTTSCYCPSQEVDDHYIAKVQWQTFSFPVCVHILQRIGTDYQTNSGNRKKHKGPDQEENKQNVTPVIVNNNCNHYYVQSGPICQNIPLSKQ